MQRATATKTGGRKRPAATNHNRPNSEPCDWIENLLPDGRRPAAIATAAEPITREIDVGLIEPSPYQPRRDFGDDALSDLDSIVAGPDGRAQGLIHPIKVRPMGGGYEIVAGERRLRRAKIAGCRTIRAEVEAMSDDEAELIVLRENESRKPLNPIELAAWLKARRARTGESQAALGKRFGHDQGWVSDHERLLELPAAVQAMVISREIPRTVARHLAPLAGHPEICETAATNAKTMNGSTPGADDVRRSIHTALREKGREIGGYHEKFGFVGKLKLSEAQRAELGIVAVDGWARGENLEFATNCKLYDEIIAEHVQCKREKEEKREKAAKSKANQAARDPSKLSSAAQKRLAEEAAQRFAERLWGFYVDWNRYAVAQKLRSGHVPYETRCRLLLDAAASWEHKRWTPDGTERFPAKSLLVGLIQDAGGKVPGRNGEENIWRGLETVADAEVEPVVDGYLAGYFFDTAGPCRIVPDDRVLRIADWLEVDLGVLWSDEQCGPLSDEYWGLHRKDQLEELAKELGVSLGGASKRADMIQRFLDYKPADEDDANTAASKALPFPKEFLRMKRPK